MLGRKPRKRKASANRSLDYLRGDLEINEDRERLMAGWQLQDKDKKE